MNRPLTTRDRDIAKSAARNTTWSVDTFLRHYPGRDPAEVKRIFAAERKAA